MKIRILFVGFFFALAFVANAKKGVDEGTRFGSREDSVRCLENTTLYQSYYQIHDYKTALEHWKIVYEECPASSRELYKVGAILIAWQIQNEVDKEKRKDYLRSLMKCYDQRIQYFGDDSRYPEPWIQGHKAIDYITYEENDSLQVQALPWLQMAIESSQFDAGADVVDAYIQLLNRLYHSEKDKYRTLYVDGYTKVNKYLDARIASACKYMDNYIAVKKNAEKLFMESGIADCKTLEDVYASQVEQHKNSADDLDNIMRLLGISNCKESDVYFLAFQYKHRLHPTPQSAAYCAQYFLKKDDFAKAISYYEEAVNWEQRDSVKYYYQYAIADTYRQLKEYPKAKSAAIKAASYNIHKGNPYILIANLYAEGGGVFKNDKILAKTAFWAAIDKLEKAKSIDPSCSEKAQQDIEKYSKFAPSKKEIKLKSELQIGKPFFVEGWIGESTICR